MSQDITIIERAKTLLDSREVRSYASSDGVIGVTIDAGYCGFSLGTLTADQAREIAAGLITVANAADRVTA